MNTNQNFEKEEAILKAYGRNQLKTTLKQFHQKWLWQKSRNQILVFGLVLGGILLSLLVFNPWQPATGAVAKAHQLFQSNFMPYPIFGMRSSDSLSTELQEALRYYDQKDYQTSIALFNNIVPTNSQIQLYLGNAFLATGQFKKAIPILERLAQSKIYKLEGQWYLALSYLHEGQFNQAISILEVLMGFPNPYQEQARAIRKELEAYG